MAVYNNETGFYARDSQLPFIPGILPPKLERRYMNPVRFLINYRIVPAFGIICGVLLTVIFVLMNIDEAKYTPLAVILFCVIGLLCIALMLSVPKTRNWEIAAEINRYDFSQLQTPLEEPWIVEDEGVILQFSRDGLKVDDKFYWYNHLTPRLATANRFNRIWVALQFGAEPMNSVFVPLSPETITAVNQFSIPLENKDAFDYLLSNKARVFEEIYKTGSFQIPSDDGESTIPIGRRSF